MNTESNAMPEPSGVATMVPAAIPTSRLLYWSVRRELWENRSIYLAPLAVAAVLLFGHLIATIGRAMAIADLAERQALLEEPSNFAALVIMGVAFLVAVFYCLDALYGERRDRSILFWKSLPVSDAMTVAAKLIIPVVVIPLLTFAITVVAQFLMLLLSSLALLGSGLDASILWQRAAFFEASVGLFYHLVAIHGFWYAPIFGWLLLASAWAQRMPFLWAVLPPVVIAAVEKIVFGSTHFGRLLLNHMSGGPEGAKFPLDANAVHALEHLSPGSFLLSPGLWIGFALAAAFLYAAVRLRREREPI
ncbi:MAG: ABC transporter permease [Gammaproteobacteria bacterium]|nr:ABC transporter permease [Gammaproteobacteria bacterium]